MSGSLFINISQTKKFDEVNYDLKSVVRSAVLATLARENFAYDAELSVTFTDNEYIKKLNLKHRNIDKETDVLSFPLYDADEINDEEAKFGIALGDVVISLERAKKQAEEVGNSFHREVAFLTVHSVLHLLGYDHERSKEDDELQCRIQREIMATL